MIVADVFLCELKKMKNICTACLSSDRQLYELGDLRTVYNLLVPPEPGDSKEPAVRVCWECRSVLHKCGRLQRNVASARDVLLAYTLQSHYADGETIDNFETVSLSSLTAAIKEDIDYSYVYVQKPETELNETIKAENANFNDVDISIEPIVKTEEQDEIEIDAPPPSVINCDPLSDSSDVQDADTVKQTASKEVTKGLPIIITGVMSEPKSLRNLMPIKALPTPGPSRTLKKIKISGDLAKQLQSLASQNKPLQLKMGQSLIQNVKVEKSMKEPLSSVIQKPKNKNLKSMIYIKNKKPVMKKDMKTLPNVPVPPSAKSYMEDTKIPTKLQMLQRFSAMLRNAVFDENRSKIKVRVLSDEELAERRESLRQELQFVNAEFKCDSCIVGYYSQQQLLDHNKAKHEERVLDTKCDICLSYIPDGMLAFHYGRHRVVYECTLCLQQMSEPRRVKEHLNSHRLREKRVKYKCTVCGEECASKHRRRVHYERAHGVDAQHTCHVCGKTFTAAWSFRDHVKRHEAVSEPVECPECHKQYKNNISFTTHFKNVHSRPDGKSYRCEPCDLSFVNQQCLNSHLKCSRRHVSPSQYKHICYQCGKGFMFERQMKDHINYVHHGQTDHVCPHCNKMYSSAGGLRKHVKFVHEGATYQKDKECKICGKTFTSPKTLREHQNIHNGTRPFKCTLCGATFKQSAALYTHRRLVHLGYKMRNKKVVKCE